MPLLKSRILAIMMALMVFVGQAVAMTVDACCMDTGEQVASQKINPLNMTTMIDHSAVIAHNSCPVPDISDCCDQTCDCASGNCASALVSPVSYNIREIIPLQKNNQPRLLLPEQLPVSLYRPPISL